VTDSLRSAPEKSAAAAPSELADVVRPESLAGRERNVADRIFVSVVTGIVRAGVAVLSIGARRRR
jgi:hypothetical protein